MPEFCSCGAQLPPDAVFCHKCGKAQRELVEPEEETPLLVFSPPPPVAAPPLPLPLDFHNPVAVRIAMVVALCAALLGFTVLPILSWLAAGFFAAFLYRRKTGSRIYVGGGVRIGWITGIIMFGIWTVVLTALAVPAAISGRLIATFEEQIRNSPWKQDPTMVTQMTQMLQTGQGVATAVVVFFLMLFVFIICLSMAGGALGAMLERD